MGYFIMNVGPHYFSRAEIKQAEHDFAEAIKRYFGEVWRIKSDGEYKGVTWDCTHPVSVLGGVWRLCQAAKHKGAERAAGKLELRDSGHLLRFIIFYEAKHGKGDLVKVN